MPWWVVALAVPMVLAACAGSTPTPVPAGPTGASSPGPSSTITGPSAAEVDAATSLLTAVRLDGADSVAALEGVRFTAAGAAAAADIIASGATGDGLWAATYVYATSGHDPEPLRAVASGTGGSPSVRLMAAAGLVARGEIAGFEPLIEALAASDPMDGAEPAGTTSEFAADVLERYANTGFGPALNASADERVASQGRWAAWLEAHRAGLRFDGASASWLTE